MLHGVNVNTVGQLLDQFVQQINRHIAVGLQVFYRQLACAQGCNFGLQGGNVFDLDFQFFDLAGQKAIFALLAGNLGLVPNINTAAD